MRKVFTIMVALVLVLVFLAVPVLAGPPWVTEKAEFDQIKVAQVPLPWQFWAVTTNADGVTTVTDKIRISPTWVTVPPPLPTGEGEILVRRQWATLALPEPIPLEELVWEDRGPLPDLNIQWEKDSDWQIFTQTGMPPDSFFDVTVEIELPDDHNIVLVAYEIGTRQDTTPIPLEPEIQGHFINEAVVQRTNNPDPGAQIVQVFVNFDVQNNWTSDVTDFELDFAGLEILPNNITWALGYVKGTSPLELWGANEESPLVVRPIEIMMPDGTIQTGTEIKWVEPNRPLAPGETIHLGLSFNLDPWVTGITTNGINATVQGYWTQVKPKVWCVETVNPHGKNIPPAGKTTLPGPKGGQNDDGFYQVFAKGAVKPGTADTPPELLKIFIVDTGSGKEFGPYPSGVRIKYTEAPGATPNDKKIGSGNGQAGKVDYHITGKGDMVAYAVDYLGNQSSKCICLVPPPPK